MASTILVLLVAIGLSQATPPLKPREAPPKRISANVYQIGTIRIDTKAREMRVPGRINEVTILEFVANTPGGNKAYESAITIDADAIRFNAALLLLGLDPNRARVPTQHFDPVAPTGDPLDMWIEWTARAGVRRVRVEELLYDQRNGQTMSAGPWVYTGSTFVDNQLMAALDGVLIGFVHSPAPLIENPRTGAVNAYGSIVLNPTLGLTARTQVTLVVRALDRTPRSSR